MAKLTKSQQGWLLVAAGVGLVAWWWWRRQTGAGSGSLQQAVVGQPSLNQVASTLALGKTIGDPEIAAARSLATGGASWKGGATPGMRWINTVTGPYYGLYVTGAMFDRWTQQPTDVQQRATAQTVQVVLGLSQPVG